MRLAVWVRSPRASLDRLQPEGVPDLAARDTPQVPIDLGGVTDRRDPRRATERTRRKIGRGWRRCADTWFHRRLPLRRCVVDMADCAPTAIATAVPQCTWQGRDATPPASRQLGRARVASKSGRDGEVSHARVPAGTGHRNTIWRICRRIW